MKETRKILPSTAPFDPSARPPPDDNFDPPYPLNSLESVAPTNSPTPAAIRRRYPPLHPNKGSSPPSCPSRRSTLTVSSPRLHNATKETFHADPASWVHQVTRDDPPQALGSFGINATPKHLTADAAVRFPLTTHASDAPMNATAAYRKDAELAWELDVEWDDLSPAIRIADPEAASQRQTASWLAMGAPPLPAQSPGGQLMAHSSSPTTSEAGQVEPVEQVEQVGRRPSPRTTKKIARYKRWSMPIPPIDPDRGRDASTNAAALARPSLNLDPPGPSLSYCATLRTPEVPTQLPPFDFEHESAVGRTLLSPKMVELSLRSPSSDPPLQISSFSAPEEVSREQVSESSSLLPKKTGKDAAYPFVQAANDKGINRQQQAELHLLNAHWVRTSNPAQVSADSTHSTEQEGWSVEGVPPPQHPPGRGVLPLRSVARTLHAPSDVVNVRHPPPPQKYTVGKGHNTSLSMELSNSSPGSSAENGDGLWRESLPPLAYLGRSANLPAATSHLPAGGGDVNRSRDEVTRDHVCTSADRKPACEHPSPHRRFTPPAFNSSTSLIGPSSSANLSHSHPKPSVSPSIIGSGPDSVSDQPGDGDRSEKAVEPPADVPLAPVKVAPWHFRQVRLLGKGDVARVYMVQDKYSGLLYAMKGMFRLSKPPALLSGL